MRIILKKPKGWLRVYSLILGISFMVWLPFEDIDFGVVFLLATAICGLLAMRFLIRSIDYQLSTKRLIFAGVFAGLAVSPMVVSLMLFKSGLHGHGNTDISFSDILSILKLTPVWGFSGFLISLGIRIWQLSSWKTP